MVSSLGQRKAVNILFTVFTEHVPKLTGDPTQQGDTAIGAVLWECAVPR